jgi:predicted dehydrogenase
MLNIGIIGCGLIGKKRARALENLVKIVSCYDTNTTRSNSFALEFNCKNVTNINEIFDNESLDVVFIATTHDSLADFAEKSLGSGKHVFIEKPGAISNLKLSEVYQLALEKNLLVHVGYNHRYHPAVSQAIKTFNSGGIGRLLFLRARYGHGGRLGYEKEWRADKELSGGGELIDQGTHLLDLSMAFMGEILLEYGATPNYFWKMNVEDNAFIVVKNKVGAIGFLHASCTEWKNTFSLEIYGETGKLEISGLGGSYGTEKLAHYKMLPEMGPPETNSWEFNEDNSWKLEVGEFIENIVKKNTQSSNLSSSIKVLELVKEIYERTNR